MLSVQIRVHIAVFARCSLVYDAEGAMCAGLAKRG